MKKILLAILSCNLIFFSNPLVADTDKNGRTKAFFIGQMIVYCILEDDGVISESDARKYIGLSQRYIIENEDIDIVVKNYVKNYSYTGVNKPCNKLIP